MSILSVGSWTLFLQNVSFQELLIYINCFTHVSTVMFETHAIDVNYIPWLW